MADAARGAILQRQEAPGYLPLQRTQAQRLGPAPASDADQLGAVAQKFEALFVKQLLDSAFKDGFAGIGDSGQAGQINSLWTQQLSDSITQGRGLGLQASLVAALGGMPAVQGPASATTALTSGVISVERLRALPDADAPLAAITRARPPLMDAINSPDDFIRILEPGIREAAAELGVSPRILMAQAALETGWGQHMPAIESGSSYNVFGIKASRDWTGDQVSSRTTEFVNGQAQQMVEPFRGYRNVAESVRDYVQFIKTQPRYANALEHGGSDQRYIRGIAEAGYATDPQYASRVLQVADSPRLAGLI